MGTGTKARIIKIGNSRGVRIPRLLLEQADLAGDVELEVHNGELVIRPSRGPRSGWDEKFAEVTLPAASCGASWTCQLGIRLGLLSSPQQAAGYPARRPMKNNGDDKMLDPETSALSSWDKAEWKW